MNDDAFFDFFSFFGRREEARERGAGRIDDERVSSPPSREKRRRRERRPRARSFAQRCTAI